MTSPYRDSRAALLERLKQTRDKIVALEDTLTPIFWKEVAPGLGLTQSAPYDDEAVEDSMDALLEAVASGAPLDPRASGG